MKLAQYLKKQGLNYSQFARIMGGDPKAVRRYCLPAGESERRVPRPATMVAIFEATDGQVQPNDFYDLPVPEKRPPALGVVAG